MGAHDAYMVGKGLTPYSFLWAYGRLFAILVNSIKTYI